MHRDGTRAAASPILGRSEPIASQEGPTMSANAASPVRVIDVQITEPHMKELLDSAFSDTPHRVEGDAMLVEEGDKRVRIELHDQPDRHLGSLDLPMEQVRFEFDGYSEAEADDFMERYRTAAMRTGG